MSAADSMPPIYFDHQGHLPFLWNRLTGPRVVEEVHEVGSVVGVQLLPPLCWNVVDARRSVFGRLGNRVHFREGDWRLVHPGVVEDGLVAARIVVLWRGPLLA